MARIVVWLIVLFLVVRLTILTIKDGFTTSNAVAWVVYILVAIMVWGVMTMAKRRQKEDPLSDADPKDWMD